MANMMTSSDMLIPEEPAREVFWEITIADELQAYVYPTLLVIGLLGNSLAFVVFSRKSICGSVTGLLLRALALGDLTVLIFDIVPRITYRQFGFDITSLSTFSCQIHRFFIQFGQEYSASILTLVTLERCVAVTFPDKAKFIFSKMRAIIMILVFTILSCIPNIPCFIVYEQYYYLDEVGEIQTYCNIFQNQSTSWYLYIKYIDIWVQTTIFSILPFCIIITCNVIIIYQLAKSRARQQKMLAQQKDKADSLNMTVLLLGTSFAFVLLTFPIFIFYVMHYAFIDTYFPGSKFHAKMYLFLKASTGMVYMNHSLHFFFYIVLDARFRQELFAMMMCKKK